MSKSNIEDAPEAQFLTVDEAATRLRQSSKTVRRRIASGEIAAHRFGRAVRISSYDLSIYIKTSRRWPGDESLQVHDCPLISRPS